MSIPFIKEFDFAYGRADRLSPLITRVICENPGPFTFTGSGTYLIGSKDIAVIDPGPANDAHLAALLSAAADLGGKITHIFVTHTHLDHCGGVDALQQATGATTYGYGAHPSSIDDMPPALDEGGDANFTPDVIMHDGDKIQTDEWTLQALHTPGHISNHLCFALPQENALFSGDHMMGWATTVVAPPDGNMADYFASLDLLIKRDDKIYYPTHGAPIENPQDFVAAVKIHRQMRHDQIMDALESGHTQIMPMVQHIYTDVDPRLHIAAALNVKAHLDMHVASGDVTVTGQSMLDYTYTLRP